MVRKVIKVGSSAAVTIPTALLKKLGLSIGDSVEVEDSGQSVVVRRAEVSANRDHHIAKRTDDFINRYRSDLEALARK